MHVLPDLFGAELGLSVYDTADQALRALAKRQQELTGRVINWVRTYEHGLKRGLTIWSCSVSRVSLSNALFHVCCSMQDN